MLFVYFKENTVKNQFIFLDLDGTLLNMGKGPDARTLRAIHAAQDAGHKVFAATGRSVHDIPQSVCAAGFDGIISSAGARVEADGKLLYDHPLPEARLEKILKAVGSQDVLYRLECRDATYFNTLEHLPLRDEIIRLAPKMRALLENTHRFIPLSQYRTEPVYKVFMYAPEPERLKAIARELEGTAKTTIFDYFYPGVLVMGAEISNPEDNKARAMALICRHYGHDVRDTLAVGDSMNDLEMLEAAGTGVAMGNAPQALKARADRVCADVENSGAAQVLESLVH